MAWAVAGFPVIGAVAGIPPHERAGTMRRVALFT